jgi:anti-sigma factor RsiW
MECQDVHAALADHLDGALPPDAADDLAAHLRACAACAAAAEGLSDTWGLLANVTVTPPDSTALRARFDALLAGYAEGAGLAPDVTRPRAGLGASPWASPGLAYGVAAAAVLVLGVIIGRQSNATPTPPSSTESQLAELRAELRDVRQMMTLSLLQQQSASERLKGVTWTERIDEPDTEVANALLVALTTDPNVNVRLASIDALRRMGGRAAVRRGVLDALPRQMSPLVQIALIDFVVEVNGREAAETLRQLSIDPMLDRAVRARAAMGLEQVG